MNERIKAQIAARMLGISLRSVQVMAARGELPGAAKIGRIWTFDVARLRGFVEDKEAECLNQTYSAEMGSIGCAPLSAELSTEKAYLSLIHI